MERLEKVLVAYIVHSIEIENLEGNYGIVKN